MTCLEIKMGDSVEVTVAYSTTSDGYALSFLRAEQTDSKVLPYLFSQCEPSYCRSIAPLQDTPSIKATYTAEITVPKDFVVGMSALNYENATVGDTKIYYFKQEITIPSYLLSIVIGNLDRRLIGYTEKSNIPTYVVTEPTLMDKAAEELVDLPVFLQKSEDYLSTYIWP